MDMGLSGVAAMVTGSSSGIGRATAEAFAREGVRVVATYHGNEPGAMETATRIEAAGGEVLTVRLDLADESSILAAMNRVNDTFGNLGVLVNNAVSWPAFPKPGERFETAPVERFRDSLRANLEGHYLLSRAVVGGMRDTGWGRIVHISTGLVEDGLPGSASYVAAKSGLHGLARTMSRELARDGILTNVVMPGFTVDESRQRPEAILEKVKAATATARPTRPEDVASLVVYLGSSANTHVTGESIRVDGHFLAPL